MTIRHFFRPIIWASAIYLGIATDSAYAFLTPDPTPPQKAAIRCMQIGCTPTALAASGLSTMEMALVMNRASELDAEFTSLQQAAMDLAEASKLSIAAASAMREVTDPAQFAAISATHHTALASITQAQTELKAAEDAIQLVLLADLPQAPAITTIIDAPEHLRTLPAPYRVEPFTEDEARAIAAALADERSAATVGRDPRPESASLLASVRARPAIAAALANQAANLESLEALFQATLSGD